MDANQVALMVANGGEFVEPLDYNGEKLCDAYLAADDAAAGAYWNQLSAREESGYLLGLAVGLMLGKGSA